MSRHQPLIVVTEVLNDRTMDYLRRHGRVEVVLIDQLDSAIVEADALVVRTYTFVTREVLAKAKRLKVIGRAGVAVENIDVAACIERGIPVVHTPAANTEAVVDFTIGHIILMNRHFLTLAGPVSPEQFHQIRKESFGRFLSGATLGIVGAGRIGSRVGRAAVGLGMKVLYNDIKPIDLDYPAQAVDKPTLYAGSDIVTIHTPLTGSTRRLINAAALAQFKRGAQFINAARGPCMDPAAVAAALHSGHLSAATIDCHDPEPLPADYPLWTAPNAILTPHSAARVPQAVENMCDVVYDVVAVLEGRPPQYVAIDESVL